MRRKFIAGNWKMFNGPKETEEFVTKFASEVKKDKGVLKSIGKGNIEIAIFPSFVSIPSAINCRKNAPIIIGAQNCHWEENGAFTGEVSLSMLKEAGCTHVIVGHSERRHVFRETDGELNKKVKAVFSKSLTPIFCVGETAEQRKAGETFKLLKQQLSDGLNGLNDEDVRSLVIAYEPVWAIGTGLTASNEDAEDACSFIRKFIGEKFGVEVAGKIRIVYGGSVKPNNAKGIIEQKNVDGVLVGGASLKVDSFLAIIQATVI